MKNLMNKFVSIVKEEKRESTVTDGIWGLMTFVWGILTGMLCVATYNLFTLIGKAPNELVMTATGVSICFAVITIAVAGMGLISLTFWCVEPNETK